MYNLIVLKVPSNPNCQASLSQACVSVPKRSLAFGDAVFVSFILHIFVTLSALTVQSQLLR